MREPGEFGPVRWGYRGTGIDIEPSCRLWGLMVGVQFFGMLYKDKPTASSNPVSRPPRYAARPAPPATPPAP